MNSSRSSSLVALLLVLVLAVGAAGAVTVSQEDAPSEAAVGSDVTATFVLTDLYTDYDQWTLRGETELENVTWTVELFNQAGDKLGGDNSYDGQSFGHPVNIENGDHEVRMTVTGTVPTIGNYTYDPAESFLFAELIQAREGGSSDTIQTYETHHYTEESGEARQAIDEAQAAIDEAGGHEQAERTLNSAIDSYENENFDNAVDLADQAQETAERKQTNQSRNRLILIAVGALVLIGIVVGAVIYWRRSRTHSRL